MAALPDAVFARGGHGSHSGGARFHGGSGVVVRAPVYVRPRIFLSAPIVAAPLFYRPAPAYYYGPPSVTYYSTPSYPAYALPQEQYIERDPPPAQSSSSSDASHYWYYCPDSQTYYPYVKECAGAWQRVSPTPPS